MKRILSLSIISVMIMSLFAFTPAFAQTDEEGYTYITDATLLDGKIFLNATSGITEYYKYKLDSDITLTQGIKDVGNQKAGTTHLIIDGQGKYTINLNLTTGNVGVGLVNVAQGSESGEAIVEFKNLKIKATIDTSDKDYAGAAVGYAAPYSKIILNNVTVVDNSSVNSSDSTVTSSAGGLIGQATGATIDMTNVYNYADVTTNSGRAAGLIGYTGTTKLTITMNKCANYGKIVANTSNRQIAGLIVTNNNSQDDEINISGCFNSADDMSATAVAALVYFRKNNITGSLTNCFNVGSNKNYCFAYINNKDFSVENCYNAGSIKQYFYYVANSTFNTTNCYYLKDSLTDKINALYGASEITKEDLQNTPLSTLFSSDVWEYNENPTVNNAYPYPQIKNNPYVKPAEELPETLGTTGAIFKGEDLGEMDFADGTVNVTGKCLAAYGIAPDKFGWTKTYGIILKNTDTEEVFTAKAKKATDDGHYGILFYGTKLVEGTYEIKPFATYEIGNVTETVYGEPREEIIE